jgi:hypothetical protein
MRTGRLVLLALVATTGIAAGQRHCVVAALDGVEPGEWVLRDTAGTAPSRSICLGDGAQLIQLHHGDVSCTRRVLDNSAEAATVNYSCPGAGHGQTAVTVETSRIIHVHTQGLARGAPFDVDYEARLVGPCGATAGR